MDNRPPNQQQPYTQQPATPQHPPQQPNVSKGELFVGMNLLSKIGVIFIIIGVIAFSAASEGYIPDAVRLGMVIAIGIIMLVGGELFRKTRSVVFANALTYGGIAELFITSLIGYYGFAVWDCTGAQVFGLIAAGLGFFLAIRHKSQPLLVVTQIFASLPIFAAENNSFSVVAAAILLMLVHAGAAMLARKNNYIVSTIIGVCLSFVHALFIIGMFNDNYDPAAEIMNLQRMACIFTLVFMLCVTVCYAGGLLLNAAGSSGGMFSWEITALCLSLGSFLIMMNCLMASGFDDVLFGGISDVVFVIVIGIIIMCFALRFDSHCAAVTALLNILLAALALTVPMLFDGVADYIGLHLLAVAVLIVSVFVERRLFTWWGYALVCIAEIVFFTELVGGSEIVSDIAKADNDRIIAIITNVVLWFALMAVYIIRKKYDAPGFRIFTCAAFFNAGILLCNLTGHELYNALLDADFRKFECRLLVTLIYACIWLVLGFAIGKPKYMKTVGMVFSIGFYAIGMSCLFFTNILNWGANFRDVKSGALFVIITIIVNIVSVLTVLDMTLQITAKAPKFAKAVGLVVSGYALASLTSVLGMNNMVAFTSWIISIIYIVAAAVWIVIGFKRLNPLLRRFGLALALFSSAKLFLFDFSEIDAMARTLLFIGFGVTLLGISFGYGIAEKKLKDQGK